MERRIGRRVITIVVVALPLIMCGSSEPPIDQQGRWQCAMNVLQSVATICRPCNDDRDCLIPEFTKCSIPRRASIPGFVGECVDPERPVRCLLEKHDFNPPIPIGDPSRGVTCVVKNAPQHEVDNCCKKRCESLFTKFDPAGCVLAEPAKNLNQACDGTEAALNIPCSPFMQLPEGQSKALVASNVDASSTVKITVEGESGPLLTPTGTIRYSVEPCGAAQCPIHITSFLLSVPNFSIADTPITDVVVQTARGSTDGMVDTATGKFSLVLGSMRVATNFRLDGKVGSKTIRNNQVVTGAVDPTTQALVLKGTVSQDNVSIALDLRATPFNRPPTAVASPRGDVECNVPGGAEILLDASGSTDPDGNMTTKLWSLGNVGVIGHGNQHRLALPLGSHTVQLQVFDKELAEHVDVDRINVVDTTKPSLDVAVDHACLWAPNHKMVLFELGAGLTARSTDTCDSSSAIEVVGVTSSQPPLGGGQGNAAPDVLFGKRAFCLRAERQGSDPAGRTYTVEVQAKDLTGNATKKVVTVVVSPFKVARV